MASCPTVSDKIFLALCVGATRWYDMFLKSEIYRENCYTCPYACKVRVGDLTLGDYWGIQREHPELLTEAGGTFVEADGISCILVNSKKGQMFLKKAGTRIELASSTLEKVSNENGQLNYPSQCPETREYILRLYQEKGYIAVERYFKRRNGIRTQYYYLKNMLPRSLKKNIKKILNKQQCWTER